MARGDYNRRMAARFTCPSLVRVWSRWRGALTLGVRGIVLTEDGCVFLVRHGYVPGWHFPGGGVERGETFAQTLARELAEEGNITLTGAPALHGLFYHPRYSNRDHVAAYVVRDFRQSEPPKPNHEIAETGFFPLGRLPEGTTGATRARLAEVIDGAPPSPRW